MTYSKTKDCDIKELLLRFVLFKSNFKPHQLIVSNSFAFKKLNNKFTDRKFRKINNDVSFVAVNINISFVKNINNTFKSNVKLTSNFKEFSFSKNEKTQIDISFFENKKTNVDISFSKDKKIQIDIIENDSSDENLVDNNVKNFMRMLSQNNSKKNVIVDFIGNQSFNNNIFDFDNFFQFYDVSISDFHRSLATINLVKLFLFDDSNINNFNFVDSSFVAFSFVNSSFSSRKKSRIAKFYMSIVNFNKIDVMNSQIIISSLLSKKFSFKTFLILKKRTRLTSNFTMSKDDV